MDALCVNQADLDERGRQVLQMGEIYSKAARTIARLGVQADNSGQALQLIDILAAATEENVSDPLTREATEALQRLKNDPVGEEYKDHWVALSNSYRRPY